MLRSKVIKRKALELMVQRLDNLELMNVKFKDYSEETNLQIKEYIGKRIDALKTELTKLKL